MVVLVRSNVANQCWDLMPSVVATTVRVYDIVFPLGMSPSDAESSSQKFDSFVDAIFKPLMNGSRVSEPVGEGVEDEVEKVVAVKQKGGSA